jgi:uncharacterized protein YdhG (YjbR/CyaY superfamily)
MEKRKRAARDIDAHIAQFPPDVRRKLEQLRSIIRQEAPGAVETISYGIPTFDLDGHLVHFAGYARHIGFYPTASGIEKFRSELKGYPTSRGAVRFPLDEPLPVGLVRKIVRFRVEENVARTRA